MVTTMQTLRRPLSGNIGRASGGTHDAGGETALMAYDGTPQG
jgi:hypothetical protein